MFHTTSYDDCNVHPSIDIWSLGTILYMLLTGVPPFRGTGKELFRQKQLGHIEFDIITPSNAAQSLVRQMLQLDPLRRISLDEILQSKWMTSSSSSKLSRSMNHHSNNDNVVDDDNNNVIDNFYATDLSLVQAFYQDWKIIPTNIETTTIYNNNNECESLQHNNNNNSSQYISARVEL
jgi:serine/threonine protein kinase